MPNEGLDAFKQDVDLIKESHEQELDQEQLDSQINKAQESYAKLESEEDKAQAKQYMESELALSDLERKTAIISQISETKNELSDFADKIGEKIWELKEKYQVSDEEIKKEGARYEWLTKLPVIGGLIAPGIVAAKKFIEHSEMGKKLSTGLSFLWFDNADNSLPNMVADFVEKQRKKVVNRVFAKMWKPAPYALVDKPKNTWTVWAEVWTETATEQLSYTALLDTKALVGSQKEKLLDERVAGKGGISHNEKVPHTSKKVYSPFKGKIVWIKKDAPENRAEDAWKSEGELDYGNYLVMEITEGPFAGKTYHIGNLDKQVNFKVNDEIDVWAQLATVEFGSGSGSSLHFSDAIGDADATNMTDAKLKNNLEDSKKLAGISIDGDKKTVSGDKWPVEEEVVAEEEVVEDAVE